MNATPRIKPSITDVPNSIPVQPETDDDFRPIHETGLDSASTNLFELADRYIKWRNYKDRLAECTKDANEIIEKIEAVIAERMVDEEVPRFTRAGKGFHLDRKVYASAKVEDQPAVAQWLTDNGYDALVAAVENKAVAGADPKKTIVEQRVNANKLAAFVKELLEDSPDDELPVDLAPLLNVHKLPTIKMREAK